MWRQTALLADALLCCFVGRAGVGVVVTIYLFLAGVPDRKAFFKICMVVSCAQTVEFHYRGTVLWYKNTAVLLKFERKSTY